MVVSPRAVLPPSTSQESGIDVNDLFSQYNSIASSMEDLGRETRIKTILAHSRFRPTNRIDDEILKFEKEKYEIECEGKQCTSYYTSIIDKLKSLREEKNGAKCIDNIYLRIALNENDRNNSYTEEHQDDNDPNTPNSLPQL